MPEGDFDFEILDNELIKVTLKKDGFEAHCFVSSMHLIEEKRKQLLSAIEREAAAVYKEGA